MGGLKTAGPHADLAGAKAIGRLAAAAQATSQLLDGEVTVTPSTGPPTHHEPDRVHLQHRETPDQGHPRGAGSPAAALAMVFELVESAQARVASRHRTAPHLLAFLRAGSRFENGHLVEQDEAVAA